MTLGEQLDKKLEFEKSITRQIADFEHEMELKVHSIKVTRHLNWGHPDALHASVVADLHMMTESRERDLIWNAAKREGAREAK